MKESEKQEQIKTTQNNTSNNNSINSKEDIMEEQTVAQSSVESKKLNSKRSKKEEVSNSEEQVADLDTQDLAEIASNANNKKPRKVSKKRLSKLNSKFSVLMGKKNKYLERIEEINSILEDKNKTISSKNGDEQIIRYTSTELEVLRNEKATCQEEVQNINFKLNTFSLKVSLANRKDRFAKAARITRRNIQANRRSLANKHYELIEHISDEVSQKLTSSIDFRLVSIKKALSEHPQKVNSLWYGILKQELVDKKIGEENVVDLLSASPSVRAKLSKRVAIRFTNEKK